MHTHSLSLDTLFPISTRKNQNDRTINTELTNKSEERKKKNLTTHETIVYFATANTINNSYTCTWLDN